MIRIHVVETVPLDQLKITRESIRNCLVISDVRLSYSLTDVGQLRQVIVNDRYEIIDGLRIYRRFREAGESVVQVLRVVTPGLEDRIQAVMNVRSTNDITIPGRVKKLMDRDPRVERLLPFSNPQIKAFKEDMQRISLLKSI